MQDVTWLEITQLILLVLPSILLFLVCLQLGTLLEGLQEQKESVRAILSRLEMIQRGKERQSEQMDSGLNRILNLMHDVTLPLGGIRKGLRSVARYKLGMNDNYADQ